MIGISTAHIPEAAGLLGVILYVGAYAALQSGLLRKASPGRRSKAPEWSTWPSRLRLIS
jgi:hypothetical protein